MAEIADRQHQSLMDGIYARQRHVYDVTRRYYLLGRDPMIRALDVPSGGSVLEIGCGTGRNLIHVARRYPDCRLYGFDISTAMLETAAQEVERAGLGERILLAEGDATAFDPEALFGRRTFDRVFISYALSMIPGWERTIPLALAAVGPRGSLHVVDFGDCSRLPAGFRMALDRWLAAFHVTPRADLEAQMQAAAETFDGKLTFTRPQRGYVQSGIIRRR